MIWSFPHQINLTFGRRAKRLHQYPACGGRGSGVALARKLLVALWKYVTAGVVIEGAIVKRA